MNGQRTIIYFLVLLTALLGGEQYSIYAQNQPGGSTISGTVKFEGAAPKPVPLSMGRDRACRAAHPEPAYFEAGEVNANGTLPNVFVFIKQGLHETTPAHPSAPVVLDQRGCMFSPHVLGVIVGQPLQILNSDPTTHNVHSIAKENRAHNQSQQPGAPPIIWKFDHPEIMIKLDCNVHPWMSAYLGVVDNPFYAVTGKDGTFSLRGVPPGQYLVEAWTETFGTQEKEVTVPPNRVVTTAFMFKSP